MIIEWSLVSIRNPRAHVPPSLADTCQLRPVSLRAGQNNYIRSSVGVARADHMNIPVHLEIAADFARFSPRGSVSLVEAVELITEAIAFCRVHALRRLLVDSTGLTGFASPTLVDRFWMAQDGRNKQRAWSPLR
jgi:hypothetical protein